MKEKTREEMRKEMEQDQRSSECLTKVSIGWIISIIILGAILVVSAADKISDVVAFAYALLQFACGGYIVVRTEDTQKAIVENEKRMMNSFGGSYSNGYMRIPYENEGMIKQLVKELHANFPRLIQEISFPNPIEEENYLMVRVKYLPEFVN